jgi:hypothetical protein
VLASDKLNFHDLHPFTSDFHTQGKLSGVLVNLNPDTPEDCIILFMPIHESNGLVTGWWTHETDGGEVDHGTCSGPGY